MINHRLWPPRSVPDLRLVESEERGDDVSEGVACEGHEGPDGHQRRRHDGQDVASDGEAGNSGDGHHRDHHDTEADLRAAGQEVDQTDGKFVFLISHCVLCYSDSLHSDL